MGQGQQAGRIAIACWSTPPALLVIGGAPGRGSRSPCPWAARWAVLGVQPAGMRGVGTGNL